MQMSSRLTRMLTVAPVLASMRAESEKVVNRESQVVLGNHRRSGAGLKRRCSRPPRPDDAAQAQDGCCAGSFTV
jgi:hypothetical protein